MRSKLISIIIVSILTIYSSYSYGSQKLSENTIGPVVAGQFYPSNKNELNNMLNDILSRVHKKSFDGKIFGIISPHAGYVYSGIVAAAAFKQVEGSNFKRVVVMAPSHRVHVNGAALTRAEFYKTPLGKLKIDAATSREIVNKGFARFDERPFTVEHSMEVILPFIQKVLKNIEIVPVIIGSQDKSTLDKIAEGLLETFPGEDTLYVASTDLSHFMTYDEAVKKDRGTISYICDKKSDEYYDAGVRDEISLCGFAPVYIMKKIAEARGARIVDVEYANSGDTAGDKSKVVGYTAAVAILPKASVLGDEQKKTLIKLSRTTLESFIGGKKLPVLPNDPALKKDGAAFVTLRKHGELRGCIGHIIATDPLDETVQQMTIAASSEDPRFPRVRPEELKDIDIEISVLTPPEELKDPMSVRVGIDGLIIEKGFNRGVLLPQVPTEQGWNKVQYLEGISRKAGLPSEAWKDAKLLKFQAIVFDEKGVK